MGGDRLTAAGNSDNSIYRKYLMEKLEVFRNFIGNEFKFIITNSKSKIDKKNYYLTENRAKLWKGGKQNGGC